jgi:antitoxin (DNA-binding transcriptional repressor) of toxin-antitoxin stability system
MASVTIEQAQATLPELIGGLTPGQEIIITRGDTPVARIVPEPTEPPKERRLGTLKGTVLYMAPDFDAPLDDFKDYM